jgi:hypothetical protein|nr:MAG TPA_asm: Protein of unknown function (DUF551) [Caudoviricetes sp.]
MKEQRTWIPVSERLPKPEEEVLVTAVRRYKDMECKYMDIWCKTREKADFAKMEAFDEAEKIVKGGIV